MGKTGSSPLCIGLAGALKMARLTKIWCKLLCSKSVKFIVTRILDFSSVNDDQSQVISVLNFYLYIGYMSA